jgi:mono/diheme cytochrome c family protein
MQRAFGILAIGVALIGATPATFGGWAVVTLRDVPEYLEVGAPATIQFEMRQHGRTRLEGLSPTVTVSHANHRLLSRMFTRDRIRTTEAIEPGLYEATITPTEAGEMAVTIDTDLYGWKVRLLPFRVIRSETAPPSLSLAERGRQLFVAKGCVTCHAKRDEPTLNEYGARSIGPELVSGAYSAEWLERKLANPAQFRRKPTNSLVMPALPMDQGQLDVLVRYLSDKAVAAGG